MKKGLFFIAFAILVSLNLSAVDFYVSPTKGNDANNGSQAAPFKTIEAAVFSVKDNIQTRIIIEQNSVIKLGAVLNFADNKKVEIIGGNVTLKADDQPGQTDPNGPVLGQGNRILRAAANCDIKIKGITFQNGRQVGYILGGAIYFAGNTLEIDSCRFLNNQAGSSGGAIGARGKNVIIKNSYFEGNNILGGGARGAAIMQCGPAVGTPGILTVENCTFYKSTTQSGGSGMGISIFDSTDGSVGGKYSNMGKVVVNNCTFLENSSPTAYQGVIDVSDGDCDVYLINNTFYKNSDCAFRLLYNKAYLANNVIVAGKQGIMSEAAVADGRPEMVAVNNIVVGTEGGINAGIDEACFTSSASSNNNIISTTTAYPLSNVALSSALSTDNFVPYLPIIVASSSLVNAGTNDVSGLFGTNYVLTTDNRGKSANQTRDIGAYEYNALTGIATPNYFAEMAIVSKSGETTTIHNKTADLLSLKVIDLTGKLVHSSVFTESVSFEKSHLNRGMFIFVINDSNKSGSIKVIL